MVHRTGHLITDEYRRLQRELHARPQGYGGKGSKWAGTVIALAKRYGCGSVLDYGCGQGSLKAKLGELGASNLRIDEYDPAIKGKDALPLFADLVVCTDVLEHIEPDLLEAVLGHLRALARRAVFFCVALDKANKELLDGRNAHLILESPDWWSARVVGAGFGLDPLGELPLPMAYGDQTKRQKRWIAVGVPC